MNTLDRTLTILASLMPVLVPLTILLTKLVLAQLPEAKRTRAERDITLLVAAVEQTFKAFPGSGAAKKAEVIRLAETLGVPVSPTTLDMLIEATVASLNATQSPTQSQLQRASEPPTQPVTPPPTPSPAQPPAQA